MPAHALPALSTLDDAAARMLNQLAQRNALARGVAALGARWLSLAEIGLMVVFGITGRRQAAWRMLLGVGLVYVACELGGAVWSRRRPFERIERIQPLVAHAGGRSFPSRHVASGLAMAWVGSPAHPRLGLLMQAIAWTLGVCRVAAGLHYPSDVLCAVPLAWTATRIARVTSASAIDRRRR